MDTELGLGRGCVDKMIRSGDFQHEWRGGRRLGVAGYPGVLQALRHSWSGPATAFITFIAGDNSIGIRSYQCFTVLSLSGSVELYLEFWFYRSGRNTFFNQHLKKSSQF